MEEDNKIKELFISSLLNELNEEDQEFVSVILDSDQKYRQLYEELRKTLGLTLFKVNTEKINISREWRRLKKDIQSKEGKETPAANLPVTPGQIPDVPAERKQKVSTYKLMLSTAIAASLLVLVLIGLNHRTSDRSKNASTSLPKRKLPDSVPFAMMREVNVSGTTRQINLKDGTEILLSNNSEIIFDSSFPGNRRAITLKGKAYFKVAKDKTRPFTVTTGDIETTVLGTTFSISAFNHADKIKVRLYEGSVVVTSSSSAVRKLGQLFYLLPGQELIYKVRDARATVGLIRKGKPTPHTTAKDNLSIENPSIPRADKGNWYMFNNQPVASVFDQLAEMYQAEIIYRKSDVYKINFIGKFDKADSLETILREITTVNNLQLTKKDKKFIITRQIKR